MDTTSMGSSSATMGLPTSPSETGAAPPSQLMLLDFFFPGFSVFSAAVQKSLHIDLTIYIPLVLLLGGITFAWRYFSEQIWDLTESHLMSVVDIRTDDEIYNMLMAWVAAQRFSQGARRFVVNTNLNSRSWYLWKWDYDDEEEDDSSSDDSSNLELSGVSKKDRKALAYTPTFGSHWFWYKGRLLIFRRSQNREQSSYLTVSEREEISISCFGRNPWILKELLHEARLSYMKRDEAKTLIYRGTSARNSSEPTWQRCMARTSRPFSTVILNEKVKKDLIDDVTDYLNPATRRWYSNRGIPYRRGYLLYGPPGTGKSSLSLALAGFFKMRIYIVSLSSPTANEENLASLFAELPRRCVVLLEDIDTAGLTHTREEGKQGTSDNNNNNGNDDGDMVPGQKTAGNNNGNNGNSGRLSLSGLLNILDGVASQEGRVLIMTTNHLEKLDKALIRPGRVDMIVKFDRADKGMTAEIFKAIFAPLEGDDVAPPSTTGENGKPLILDAKAEKEKEEKLAQEAKKKSETIAKVSKLAEQFASKVPEREFSPAEIQGYLLKNKRNPEAAVEGAEKFVEDTRREKREKEAKDAEDKKKEKEEAEKKKKEEEEKKQKEKEEEEKKKKKSRKEKKKKKAEEKEEEEDSGSSSSSESESESESDSEDEKMKRKKKRKAKKAKAAKKKAAAKKDLKTVSKADDGEGEEETTSQQQPLDTPPLTPKKDSFAAEVGFPELLFVKHHGSNIPAITVEEVATPSTGLGVKGVSTEGGDSGYGTPTASVKGDDELDAGVVSAVPAAAAAITAA